MQPETDLAIKVEDLSKVFKLPHDKSASLKSAVINFHKKGYELQEALKDVSFEIKKGEFFGIVGRNGSGKSTLLKLIAGIYTPTTGSIKVNGSLAPFIELGVGFNPELTGRENVFLNGALLGFDRKQMRGMYQDIVDFAELERFMDQKLKNYSSGMQVRLAFSIAIRARSDILLLDEVLAVGDSAFQRKCYRYFEDIKGSGTTIVLVTHSMDTVQRFCTNAIMLESGKLVYSGDPNKIADEYREANLAADSEKGKPKSDRKETVKIEITEQTKNKVIFRMSHQQKEKEEYYFGFSVIKDGVTFAELNSMELDKAEIKNKSLGYELDINGFNPGVYELSAVLFKKKNREIVAFTKERPQFFIRGGDLTRGGALHLEDNWR